MTEDELRQRLVMAIGDQLRAVFDGDQAAIEAAGDRVELYRAAYGKPLGENPHKAGDVTIRVLDDDDDVPF